MAGTGDRAPLAAALTEVGSTTIGEGYDAARVLGLLVERTPEVTSVDGCGVMIADLDGALHLVAASDGATALLEALQVELGDGPCVRAHARAQEVVLEDLAQEHGMPAYATAAVELGVRGVVAVPLRARGVSLGVVDLYSRVPGRLADPDLFAARALVDVAAAVIANARTHQERTEVVAQLQHALSSRIIIEQAKGRLAERHGIGVDDAFERLRITARSSRRRLAEVAAEACADPQWAGSKPETEAAGPVDG